MQNNEDTYFVSFGVEHITNEIKTFIDCSFSIKTNIFRIQAHDSIKYKYFCIGFIDFMLAGKTLTEFTNLFSTNKFKRNDDIILNYFTMFIKIAECNSIKHDFHKTPNMYPNLNANISNDQQFRLNKIDEIKRYFIAEIRERELMSKNLK